MPLSRIVFMYIGEISKLTCATPRAIRLYESIGLLNVKRQGKYRVYTQSDVDFVFLIKQAQALGIQLSELRTLKQGDSDLNWRGVLSLLDSKRNEALKTIQERQLYLLKLEACKEEIENCLLGLDSPP